MTRLHNSDGIGRVRYEDAPPAVTAEAMNTAISAAMANLLSKDLPLAFKPFNDQFTSITETLKTLTPPKKEEAAPVIPGVSPELQSALLEEKRKREALEAKLNGMTEENKVSKAKAEAAERNSAIRQELSKYQFASEKAFDNAYKLINMDVKRSDDGALIAGDLTLDAYVKDFLTVQNDHFLKGIDTAGSGASKGSQRGSGAVVSLEDIGPSMTAEKRAQVLAAIATARG